MKLICLALILVSSFADLHSRFLIEEPTCNISARCTSKTITTRLDELECIQNFKVSDITKECHDVIRKRAKEYFTDENIKKFIKKHCHDDVNIDCKNKNEKFIFCLLDQKEKIKDLYCEHLVRKMEYIITADFTLVSDFSTICENDIRRIQCNRFETNNQMVLWDNKLDCLQKHIDSVSNTSCRQEVFYLSEIQGEDMKLDTQLFFSCSMDRLRLCSFLPVDASFQMVYKCLLNHISDTVISPACQEQLLKREKLVSKDAKISKGLIRACRDDIRVYHCRRLVSEDKGIRLAQILLCLENSGRNGSKVSQECRSEIIQHRKLLMEDYRLSPEVVSHCSNDIEEYCSRLELGSRTIHCLMEHSRPRRRKDRVSPPCQKALQSLIRTADVAEDWRVDPIIRESCNTAVNRLCKDIPGGNARVMSCLLDNIGSRYLNEQCELALIQLQYFVSRDFKLDPQLYSACFSDAITLCHITDAWDYEKSVDFEHSKLILPCLFRYMRNHGSNKPQGCVEEVKRVMRHRAVSVELLPDVEMACIDDLALYCHDKTAPGEEMMCLQERFQTLTPGCRSVIGNFTEVEVGNIDLNPIMKTYCSSAIASHCQDEAQNSIIASDNIMGCLIKHKNDADIKADYKCRATIEHFQLVTLNDYHFTVAFKHSCRPYVIRYCPKVRNKAEVVECLSEVTRNDTITGEKYKISKECRYQLRSQLHQQRELVDLDPKLKSACDLDINRFCKNVLRGSSRILECLVENINLLTMKCHKVIFRIQQQDFTDSSSDYTLTVNCKNMIKEYCEYLDLSQALSCLKKYKDDPMFDKQCRITVNKRMLQQSLDYRLNPNLQMGCNQDITKYCMDVVKSRSSDIEFEGKVIKCLKVKFREQKLRKECEKQVSIKLKEEALNYKLNPLLRNLCADEIRNICQPDVLKEENGNVGRVEECLKVAFIDGQIISRACRLEVAGLIEETKADINVDPLLHQACMNDISKHCPYVTQGAGRIIQCLQNVLLTSKKGLQMDCELKLKQRIQMFKNADTLVKSPPNNIEELIEHVSRSPSSKYIFITLGFIVGFIFFSGLACGKITQNSIRSKNK